VLHITHYMSELVDADRIVVMDSGRIVAVGTPRQIFSKVAMLKQIGLDVPQMTELAYLLREDGYDLPQDILTIREMVEALCH
jgi:energy-coupling factor transport system ATP-binding protein